MTNKNLLRYTIFLLLCCCPGLSLKAQRYENGLIDKVVALVGNEIIQLSSIEQEVQMQMMQGVVSDKNIRCKLLENLMISKLMLNQARIDSLPANTESIDLEVENHLQQIKTRLGGEKATEEYFHKPLFKIKQELIEAKKEETLVSAMQSKIIQGLTELTPSEIEKYYEKVPKDSLPIISTQYQIRQIVLYPKKEDAVMLVRERLLEFRERILNGEKFSTLAMMYSQDRNTARRGGELGMATKGMYWPAFGDAASILKIGQVSQIVETPDGFHLIQMIAKEGDMFNVRHILLRPDILSSNRTACRNRLDSILQVMETDSLDFAAAAGKFSEDPKSRLNGGLLVNENSGSPFFEKDQLKASDYNMLKKMKVGEISKPFESRDTESHEGNLIFKVIKLEKIIPSHVASIEQDYNIIQNMAKQSQSLQAIEDFIAEKQKTTYIRIDPLFKNCSFEREGWIH